MMGTQCDTCRAFAPSTPAGWFILGRVAAPEYSGILSALSGTAPERAEPATFCSAQCLAEYAYLLAVTGSTGSTP